MKEVYEMGYRHRSRKDSTVVNIHIKLEETNLRDAISNADVIVHNLVDERVDMQFILVSAKRNQ